jgi:uncharacterized membrane protein
LLTDGIFAVVMTLLVLEISVPQISSSHDAIDSAAAGTELLSGLFDLWSKLLSFGISQKKVDKINSQDGLVL